MIFKKRKIFCFLKVHEIPQIKIFRFESPIIYFNADYFRESLLNTVGIDLKSGQRRTVHPEQSNEQYLNLRNLTHVIIDCSSINQLDYSGGKIFLQAIKELNECQYRVYLCNLRCKELMRKKEENEILIFFRL
jgi:MFS superfamily sulfate permease-like transporter